MIRPPGQRHPGSERRFSRRRVLGSVAATLLAASDTVRRAPEAAAADRGHRIVTAAMKHRGKGYSYLGTGPRRFGCSGLVYVAVLEAANVDLTVDLVTQWRSGRPIGRKRIRKGDLVFFKGTQGAMKGPTHVGIAIDPTRMIHAANRKQGVRIDKIATYKRHYLGARRI